MKVARHDRVKFSLSLSPSLDERAERDRCIGIELGRDESFKKACLGNQKLVEEEKKHGTLVKIN